MSEEQIRKTRCVLWYLLHLDLFKYSTLDLFNTQANGDAVPVPPPSPFALTAEVAYTSVEVKIQCLKYSFY